MLIKKLTEKLIKEIIKIIMMNWKKQLAKNNK